MTALTEYIRNRDNLLPLSMYIASGILLLLFILLHLFGYEKAMEELELRKKMEVRELMKLSFKPKAKSPNRKLSAIAKKMPDNPKAKVDPTPKPESKPLVKAPDVRELLKGLNTKDLIKKKSATRRTVQTANVMPNPGIKSSNLRSSKNVQKADFNISYSSTPSNRPSGRRAASGSSQGQAVSSGSVSRGSTTGTDHGVSVAGRASTRTTRVAGTGAAGASISLPSTGSGDTDGGSIDLHALIQWMKQHPGTIPKLVAYEMSHQRGDLSSAVNFTMGGKRYTFYISCNEKELQLRVCLVERNTFILLKDQGLTEQSNYLTTGDVLRKGAAIQSLISARKAPGNKATEFYGIFWSWWQSVDK
ncbi:MAG: hypothetical protein DWQ10_12645 [Calditrichaeota bacterium]|nr:MAG: hypothetical protein DWQ10_12645 [Calditrichota bacterium]